MKKINNEMILKYHIVNNIKQEWGTIVGIVFSIICLVFTIQISFAIIKWSEDHSGWILMIVMLVVFTILNFFSLYMNNYWDGKFAHADLLKKFLKKDFTDFLEYEITGEDVLNEIKGMKSKIKRSKIFVIFGTIEIIATVSLLIYLIV